MNNGFNPQNNGAGHIVNAPSNVRRFAQVAATAAVGTDAAAIVGIASRAPTVFARQMFTSAPFVYSHIAMAGGMAALYYMGRREAEESEEPNDIETGDIETGNIETGDYNYTEVENVNDDPDATGSTALDEPGGMV